MAETLDLTVNEKEEKVYYEDKASLIAELLKGLSFHDATMTLKFAYSTIKNDFILGINIEY